MAQQQPQDPSNPNKNVINIISINISNKNGEQVPLTLMPMPMNMNVHKVQNNVQNQIKTTPAGNMCNLKPAVVPQQILNLCTEKINSKELSGNANSLNSANSFSTIGSPNHERTSFFDDFCEEDSSASFGFNPHNEMDEVDKFFNW